MKIEITLTNHIGNKIEKVFEGDYYELHVRDWSEAIRDELDEMQNITEPTTFTIPSKKNRTKTIMKKFL